MATLQVTKIKAKINLHSEIVATIDSMIVKDGIIHFVPVNKKYQYLKLTTDNCIIIKYDKITTKCKQ